MKDSAVSALRRALRYTIGTGIAALILSNLLPEADAERLATTAYLAVIFAALTMVALHFVSARATAYAERPWVVTLPATVQSVVVVGVILLASAALAGEPGAEALLLLVCAAATATMAFSGAGLFRALHVELAAGGTRAALTRYGVLAAIVALLLGSILSGEMKAIVVEAACWAVVMAAVFFMASLIRRTPFGSAVLAVGKGGPTRIFERMAGYAAYTSAGALLVAWLWPDGGDTCAFLAYVALVVATVAVAIEIRLRVAASRRASSIPNPR